MPSTTNFGLDFNQTEVRSAGAHTNASQQQPAQSGGGGGTGVQSVGSGTDITITGTATNPVVNVNAAAFDAAGSAAAAQAAAEAASYPGLGKIPPSSPNSKINWNLRYFVEDYASLQLAFNAACGSNGILYLPPGGTALPAGGLVIPNTFSGAVAIRGCGRRVSVLQQSSTGGSAYGLYFDLSQAGTPNLNTVDCADFDVVSTGGANAATAVYLTYGTSPTGSSEITPGSHFHNVACYGGYWTGGFAFYSCWHLECTSLYAEGTPVTAPTGIGFYLGYGINCQFTACTAEFWNVGVQLDNGGYTPVGGNSYDPQGIWFNGLQIIRGITGIYINGQSSGTGDGIYISDWMVDNGSLGATCTAAVVNNYAHVNFHDGVSEQKGGGSGTLYHVTLNNCNNCMVHNNVFNDEAGFSSYYMVYLKGTTANSNVHDNTGVNMLADSTTTNCYVHDNNYLAGSFTNNSTVNFTGLSTKATGTVTAGASNSATVLSNP
jgi:hypothetical protein